MTAVCTPYHAMAMTMTDSSHGSQVQEPAREPGDGRVAATAAERDWGIFRLTQVKEVIRDG